MYASHVQTRCLYTAIIRYIATAYKPLTPIDRCFTCQQFEHKLHNCVNEAKCFKCGDNHAYNPNCLNPIKCANCEGFHIAEASQCPVKISYCKTQQKRQETQITPKSTTVPYLHSSAQLYSIFFANNFISC
ncbi:unnamed protein product [Rotaria sp. Silwood1]|nr:unnamed protein product [Rotaria sp. Silwood1]CAF5032678.1 unnamed protein product [Rotaria sp. Silwood1]